MENFGKYLESKRIVSKKESSILCGLGFTVFKFVDKKSTEEMKNILRLKQRALDTERTYIYWLRNFYRFLKGTSPFVLNNKHIKSFLTYLAVDRHVAASTQNQAFNAILFFYRHVLAKDVGDIRDVVR